MKSLRSHATDHAAAEPERASAAPGKLTRSEGEGAGLPDGLRGRFEHSLGTDLSSVRVHTGESAASESKQLSARAFAVGDDIHFGADQYQPGSAAGDHLIAHEVAHTVQQRGGAASPQTKLEVSSPGDALEREADVAADRMVAGEAASVTSGAKQSIARQLDGEPEAEASGETSGDAAGESTEVAPTVEELFAMGGPRSWPTELAASTVRAGGLSIRAGSMTRRSITAPTLVVPRARPPRPPRGAPAEAPAPAPAADSPQAEALRLTVEAIRARLAGVEVPATNGAMLIRKGGFAYRAATHAEGSPAAAEHSRYMGEDNPLGLGSPRDLRRWQIFQFVLGEGDTSAVNAYDNQRITLGAGFSAKSGAAGEMLNRLPAAMRQRLFDYGILIEGDDTFTVLDLDRGVVERGENALRVLQVDQTRLAVYSNLAQSTEEVSSGTETHSAREWMLRAQFEQVTASIPDVVFDWPLPTARVAVKLHHWQSGPATWGRLVGWAGDGPNLSAMCRGARNQIWAFHDHAASGDYSLTSIESRFSERARQAGAGAIQWSPRPSAATP